MNRVPCGVEGLMRHLANDFLFIDYHSEVLPCIPFNPECEKRVSGTRYFELDDGLYKVLSWDSYEVTTAIDNARQHLQWMTEELMKVREEKGNTCLDMI